jgi:predicted Zn-dependent peptidase
MKLTQIRNEKVCESYFFGIHESGLKISILPKKNIRTSVAIFGTNFGSVNSMFKDKSTSKIMRVPDGIAHYLEHKLFEQKDGENAITEFSKIGARPNAYTNFDTTAYHFKCTSKFYETFEILLNFVQNPYFTQENVDKERGIIFQEIRQYDDEPDWVVENNLLQAMYHSHPVRNDIAGTVESIQNITPENLYTCYKYFYSLNNMSLCIVGDVDKDKTIDFVKKRIISKPQVAVEDVFPQEPYKILRKRVAQNFDVSMPVFRLGFKEKVKEERLNMKDLVLTDLILEVFSSEYSPLYRELLDEKLINSSFYYSCFEGPNYLSVIFSGESKNPDAVAEKIKEAAVKFKSDENSISEEDLVRAKKVLHSVFITKFDYPMNICQGLFEATLRNEDFFSYLDILAIVKIEDLRKRLGDELDSGNCSLSIILPNK